jgi:thioredoxin 2
MGTVQESASNLAAGASGDGSRVSATPHVVCPHCHTTNRVPRERLGSSARCGNCKQPLLAGSPFELSRADFARHVAASDLPLVVDFWAPWCAPCRSMAPAYEQAAARLAPGVQLAKLNTEAEPELASRYGIRAIPTLIAFKGGREIARRSGASDLPGLLQWITSNVSA